jgi:hypothetical protein
MGNVYSAGSTDKGGYHVEYILLKLNTGGSLLWEQKYSRIENSEDFVYSVGLDNSNNVYVTGISFDSLSDYDIATIKYSQAIGITQISNELPLGFFLHQNYPNPFNPVTKIKFDIPAHANITIKLYDVLGNETAVIFSGELNPGFYETELNASAYASGVYFYRLESPGFSNTKRMVVLK